MKTIKQVEAVLAKIETAAIIIILSMMIVLSFSQVILRNILHEGILWADLFLRQAVLWVGFLGASLATREERHISISILPTLASKPVKRVLRLVIGLSAAIISATLAVAAWGFVKTEREAHSTIFLYIPTWTFQTILPYSFAVITIRFLLHSLEETPER